MNNLEGQIIAGRYEIREWIGEDQLLDVYAAYDRRRSVPVMVKFLRSELASDRNFLRLFREQVTPLCELQQQHLVPCLGFEQSRDGAFFIMDQGHGLTLDKFLWRQPGPLDPAQATLILSAICAALHHLHGQGLYHGDLSPARVWLDESGQVMVSDAGLTRLAEKIAGVPFPLISPEYSAPEQCAGQPGDHRSDIYAAAILLYEMLSRERPFQGDEAPEGGSLDMRLCWEQVHALPPALTEVCPACPMTVEVAVLQALAKDPEARPQSAREFYRQVTAQVLQPSYPPSMELAVMIGGKAKSRGGTKTVRDAASRLVAFFSQAETPPETTITAEEEVPAAPETVDLPATSVEPQTPSPATETVPIPAAEEEPASADEKEPVPERELPQPKPQLTLPQPVLPEMLAPARTRVVVPSTVDHQERVKELLQRAGAEYLRGRWDRAQMICAVILELVPSHVAAKVLSSEAAIAARTEQLYTSAQEALAKGEREQASELLRQILIEDRTHREARELFRRLKQPDGGAA